MLLSAFHQLFCASRRVCHQSAALVSQGFGGGGHCQAFQRLEQPPAPLLSSVVAQGCQAAAAVSDCVYGAEGALRFLCHQLGSNSPSPWSSRQRDRGMDEEQDVTEVAVGLS